jgi:cyclopropane-fatty-acyl-phospholipid synthase
MEWLTRYAIKAAEAGWISDVILRAGIRRLCRQRLRSTAAISKDCNRKKTLRFIDRMDGSPIALVPSLANDQHYELPARFFSLCLGAARKYSCGFWDDQVNSLSGAEESALRMTCQRAKLCNGQSILELGCGWGSLTLWMARQYPDSEIVAISNSHSQKEHIAETARSRGLTNIEVITSDINLFEARGDFDRIVSVEMFEHLRNYRKMFERISAWLKPDGMFFIHIFSNQDAPYAFENENADDWMSRYFFTGGMMPSHDLPLYFQDHLELAQRWWWPGTHYQKTAEAWLSNFDARHEQVLSIFEGVYGKQQAKLWCQRWRMFFIACAELFGLEFGSTWGVSHYLFKRQANAA